MDDVAVNLKAPPGPVRERGAPAPSSKDAAGEEDLDLETLQRRFVEEAAQQCHQMLESLEQSFDAQKSARVFHQWVGAAGILGYMTISGLARQAEQALSAQSVDLANLRELVSNLIREFAKPVKAGEEQFSLSGR